MLRAKKRKKRRRRRRGPTELVVAVAWYTQKQWELLREVADDPEALDDSYEDWLHQLAEYEASVGRKLNARRIPIQVSELVAWCRERGRPIDGSARAEFASEKLMEASRNRSPER